VPFIIRSLNALSSTPHRGFCDFAASACILGTFRVADRPVRSFFPSSVYSFVRLHRSSCRLSSRDGSASVLDPSSRNYTMLGRRLYRLYSSRYFEVHIQSTYPVDMSLPVCLSSRLELESSSSKRLVVRQRIRTSKSVIQVLDRIFALQHEI